MSIEAVSDSYFHILTFQAPPSSEKDKSDILKIVVKVFTEVT